MLGGIGMKIYSLKDHWCLLSYYTVCPEAPDGSGRVLLGAADQRAGRAYAAVLDADGYLLDKFGGVPLDRSFWHTGLWQSWSPDGRFVYYQSGEAYDRPAVTRRELATGKEVRMEGADMEGAPTGDAPVTSGLLGMLYAAGYGDTHFHPDRAPVPFGQRDKHGLFTYDFDARTARLALSVAQLREIVGDPQLDTWDREQQKKTGDGTTLMAYCLRWSPDGKRCLFHFGNHCVDKRRGEPKILYILTANADLSGVKLALNLCEGHTGVHWSYQPDGKRLIGYGYDPQDARRSYLMEVNDDGSEYHALSRLQGNGGHPSRHPFLPHLAFTDRFAGGIGRNCLIDLREDRVMWDFCEPENNGPVEPGRNPTHVDNHPVFSRDGKGVWMNRMRDGLAELVRIEMPKECLQA